MGSDGETVPQNRSRIKTRGERRATKGDKRRRPSTTM